MTKSLRWISVLLFVIGWTQGRQLAICQELRLQGFAFENWKDGKAIGFSHFGDGDSLAAAIANGSLGRLTQQIEQVRLEQHRVTPKELAAISRLESIQELIVGMFPDKVELTVDSIEKIAEIRSLKSLTIYARTPPDAVWKGLSQLSQLEELVIGGEVILRSQDLESLGGLTKLTHLELDCDLETEDFSWLGNLKSLNSIRINSPSLSKSILNAIGKLSRLTRLELSGFRVNANLDEQNDGSSR